MKPIEDENHVFISCPLLYSSIRKKLIFCPENADDLAGLLSDRTIYPSANDKTYHLLQ